MGFWRRTRSKPRREGSVERGLLLVCLHGAGWSTGVPASLNCRRCFLLAAVVWRAACQPQILHRECIPTILSGTREDQGLEETTYFRLSSEGRTTSCWPTRKLEGRWTLRFRPTCHWFRELRFQPRSAAPESSTYGAVVRNDIEINQSNRTLRSSSADRPYGLLQTFRYAREKKFNQINALRYWYTAVNRAHRHEPSSLDHTMAAFASSVS